MLPPWAMIVILLAPSPYNKRKPKTASRKNASKTEKPRSSILTPEHTYPCTPNLPKTNSANHPPTTGLAEKCGSPSANPPV